MEKRYANPIIPGFYPDPSICRVGEDYYLATSSFELFPALPVFHSRDLVHWKQLGYALDRTEQVYLDAHVFSGGMMAPTIRFHRGKFYMICCNFAEKGNFLITAEDPAGPWSNPLFLPEVDGIDASIFFDGDDQCYVCSTGHFEFPEGPGQGIWGAKFDPETGKLLSEKQRLWQSAVRGATAPEAPHIYHIGDWYYLLTAEGGTEHTHSVVIGRSKAPLGDYEGCPHNPLITHRHLGRLYPIGNPGHADLVETQNGQWYAVLLASRLVEGFHKNMGRETYMVPVSWENGWPIFSPGTGKVEWSYPVPELPEDAPAAPEPETDDFDGEKLDLCWSFWGTPYQDFWRLEDGKLKLLCLPRKTNRPMRQLSISDLPVPNYEDNVSCLLRRQRQPNFDACCHIRFASAGPDYAGMLMMQQLNHQLRVEKRAGCVRVVLSESSSAGVPYFPGFEDGTTETVLAEYPCGAAEANLRIRSRGQDIAVYCNDELVCRVDGRRINPERIGPMVGTMVGMFASAEGETPGGWAEFDWFRYSED